MEAFEKVLKRFTRMLSGLEGKSCKEYRNKPRLVSLELQRLRGDPKGVYKIMRGRNRIDSQNLFPGVGMTNTRAHSFKIGGQCLKVVCRATFLSPTEGERGPGTRCQGWRWRQI